ncbi:hypothetical protein BKA62DRAFT_60240 [Auriculariales sp. MPI-PUGE-AT-0066]|nr:hypothetical protein BKA62DRAFT_60240 [Auriculariales sp. MPI-PUGE-AT-0066]
MANAPPRLTVAIIGAGVAGPAFGLQLLAHPRLAAHYRPILFDQTPDPALTTVAQERRSGRQPSAGAAVGIFANGLYPLYKLGLRTELEAVSTAFDSFRIFRCPTNGTHKQLAASQNPTWSAELQDAARTVSRADLQRVLLDAFYRHGGEVRWDKSLAGLRALDDGRTEVAFDDASTLAADLVVGADGGFSGVRRHVLHQRNASTAEERWLPDFVHQNWLLRDLSCARGAADLAAATETHALWLDGGVLSSAPLPGGRIRWDLILDAQDPPPTEDAVQSRLPTDAPAWATALMPSPYTVDDSIKVLRQFENVYHPTTGTFGTLLSYAERIIRRPLRQRVWNPDEIQHGSVVLIGDASRLMLPSSGQGTGFAIEDATLLARYLLTHHCESPSPERLRIALESHARERVPRSQKMARVAYWAGEMSIGRTWFWRVVRDWMPVDSRDRKKLSSTKDSWPFSGRFDVDS